ncbi:branched-chain amino acid ABC transporter permease [Solicola gregarius]|uniref:Branched-chain amino acid ABC transporter permease n=1 Tax=Solicola gregarius TaxID=2908642 RepID=A0AA46YKA6_9ACTN|nr:branched-chain amino acid ABC transporter permease [Solicola gregarius]UYM05307.1 branched-chain amino acid ABC transporter permease [Solicola gregarius]
MDWSILENALQAAVGTSAIYFCLAAIGLNVQFGYTGLINFGQAGFLALGAYGLAVSVASWGLPFFVGIGLGLVLSAVLALLLGIPTLRLRADYLAIATIAAAEVLRLVLGGTWKDTLGGRTGINDFTEAFYNANPYSGSILGFRSDEFWVMTVGWVVVALSSVFVWLLVRSPWGRVLKAIREDEEAARSLGKNVYAYKMQALVLGGMIGCLGGFAIAIAQDAVQPNSFNLDMTFIVFTMLILGGAARVIGPVFGAIVFWGLLSLVDGVLSKLTSGSDPTMPTWLMDGQQVGPVRFMLVGLVLMLLMIYRPQGVFGDRKEIALDAR